MDREHKRVEESMDEGTTQGAEGPRGRRWRRAVRQTGAQREMKGTDKKNKLTLKQKEWSGSKRKRDTEEQGEMEGAWEGAVDEMYMEQDVRDAKFGGGQILSGLENGGKILGWEGATVRGRKKRRKNQVQQNKVFWYSLGS